MTSSMNQLKARFGQQPLIPGNALAQQNTWRLRWGMPQKPLQPGEDWDYYLDPTEIRGRSRKDPRVMLRYALETDRPGQKYFLTGAKGSGKSTTANALWKDPAITARYTLLGFTIQDYLNLADTDAYQILAVMMAQLVEAIRDAERGANIGDLGDKAAIKALKTVLGEVRPGVDLAQVNVNVFGFFTAIFRESASARQAFSRFADGRSEEVMQLFGELVGILEENRGKRVLFIVDDLDKLLSDDVRRAVFQLQLPTLLAPPCAAVYSYPLEVDHDPFFESLKRKQPNRYVLGNVKLRDKPDGPLLDDGRRVMTEFVRRRLDGHDLAAVIDLQPAEWDRVLHYTAGNFRELCRLLCLAFQFAAMDEMPRADRGCFEDALEQMRQDYNPFVQRHRRFLEQMQYHRGQPPEDADDKLLSTLLAAFAIVEYPNEPGWLGIHPVVDDLLAERKSRLDPAP